MKQAFDRAFPYLLTGVYAAWGLAFAFYHEVWRDEAQAWLLARDLNPIQLLNHMPYEASSALWHVLLMPLAKLGLPVISMSILHVVIASAAVFILARYAPFPKLMTTAFAFSVFMGWEWLGIARSYSLSILLLFLVVLAYNKRTERPWIFAGTVFLLAQANMFGLLFAGIFGLIFLLELLKEGLLRSFYPPLSLMIFGGMVAGILSAPPVDSAQSGWAMELHHIAWAVGGAFFYRDVWVINIVAAVFLAFICLHLLPKPKSLLWFSGSLLSIFVVLTNSYSYYKHFGFVLISILVAMWLAAFEPALPLSKFSLLQPFGSEKTRRVILILLTCAFLFLSKDQPGRLVREIEYPFSGGKNVAEFIQRSYNNKPIVGHTPAISMSALPYLPGKQFWYVTTESWGTYQVYTEEHAAREQMGFKEFIETVKRAFPNEQPIIILSQRLWHDANDYGYEEVYVSPNGVIGYGAELYSVYAPIE